jgi:hypothetical protein
LGWGLLVSLMDGVDDEVQHNPMKNVQVDYSCSIQLTMVSVAASV